MRRQQQRHGLGRLPAPDTRDRNFPMRALLAEAPPVLPAQRHWRVPRCLDQGPTSSCVGHAWRSLLDAAPIMVKPAQGPAALALYREAQKVDEWPGEEPAYYGTSVRAGAKVLQAQGYISGYSWAWDLETLRAFVLRKGPVVLGTEWYEGFFKTDTKGYVRPTGSVVGGHAYLAVGYSQVRQAFRCMNSWGRGWGENGRFWIEEAVLAQLIARQGEACTATEAVVRAGV